MNLDLVKIKEAELHFGASVRKRSPQMSPYIYKKSKKVYILNWKKILASCLGLENYLEDKIGKEKKILFLSTNKLTRQEVKLAALSCNMPFINSKWKGGFFTNFGQIKKKIQQLKELDEFIESDNFRSLIKKEQSLVQKKRDKLYNIYEGLVKLEQIPDALFVTNFSSQITAVREAKRMGVPVIAVCNSNNDPRLADYPLFGNNDNPKPIIFFANYVAETINKLNQ